jgi:hypothetical protein
VPEPIRFYMDQHFPFPASQGLRRHGVDVLTAQEAEQLTFATAHQRVMVTFDTDYLVLHQSGVQHAGIAWCHEQEYSIGQLIQALLFLHGILSRDAMQNHVEYV